MRFCIGILCLLSAAIVPSFASDESEATTLPFLDGDALLSGAALFPSGVSPQCALSIGTGSGAAGSTGNPVSVNLTNDAPVSAIQFNVVDTPNDLTASGCNALPAGYACNFADDGTLASITFAPSNGELLDVGTEVPILQVLYDVGAGADPGTVALALQSVAIDADTGACEVTTVDGSFMVGAAAVCGNGVVETGEDCDDSNTDDGDCCSSTCSFESAGSACDDGMFCTDGDTCDGAGTCDAGGPLDCNDDDICTDDSCDEEANACDNVFDETNDPTCVTAVCGNGEVEDGEDCDDGNTDDGDCCSSTCSFESAGSACDDGMFCTDGDTCDGAGTCDAGGPLDCNDDDICTDDSCDEEANACDNVFDETNDPTCVTAVCGNGEVEDGEDCDDGNTDDGDCCSSTCSFESAGSACDDGMFCTDGDTCDGAGTCDAGGPLDCNDDDICTDDSCDEEANACDNVFDETNDPTCVTAVCGNGEVEEGEDCDDGNTDDGDCCSSTCSFESAGSACDDGMFCTDGDTCDGAGTCDAGGPLDCNDDDICTDDSCDEEANACDNVFDETNDPTCVTAVCGNGEVEDGEDCDDGNTDDGDCCSSTCSFESAGSTCDDGMFCTDGDTCDGAGTCDAGGALDCNDDDICTDDSCDEEANACDNVFDETNDPTCVTAVCGNGEVEEGEDCDDGNTDDGDCCSSTCSFESAGSACDDGMFCTDGDTCDGAGTCDAGGALDCNDDDICTDDSCDEEANACDNVFDETNDPTCVTAVCGNGEVEEGEDCDDGNTDDGDCCSSTCSFESAGSSCDDGMFCTDGDTCDGAGTCDAGGPLDCNDDDICTDDSCDEEANACDNVFDETNDPTCETAECGNGEVEEGEECDDGNDDNFDSCRNDCTLPFCGDGIIDEGEGCDDGNDVDDDFCTNDCFPTICGDGIVNPGEECDDGDDDNFDDCRNDCTLPFCGDGIVDPGEECDDGNDVDDDGCPNNCSPPPCGDGIVSPGEECDDGNDDNFDGCRNDCTLPFCGDGIVDPGEECDDGNDVDDDACPNDCVPSECGDGVVDIGEECDDGNDDNFDGCRNDCTVPVCGDGITDADEECDDGNDVDTDDCRNDCTLPACGDGIVDQGEDCDDGNTASGDCCSDTCSYEAAGSSCDDGMFCTDGDTCDGAGTCDAGGELDCDDGDICTDDSCNEDADTCDNTFNPDNDPTCETLGSTLTRTKSCGYPGSSPEICFDFQQGADDGMPGGADETSAIDWCITWDPAEVSFDCEDMDGDEVPDDVTFLVNSGFTSIITCTPENPDCRLRLSILDVDVPLMLLPNDTLACLSFDAIMDVGGDGMIAMPFGNMSTGDVLGSSIPVNTVEESLAFDDCCLADCNDDSVVDIADAVSVVLELSDLDGDDFCDTRDDVPFDGAACCDCNEDTRVDIADAVCIVNGLGSFDCPTGPLATSNVVAASETVDDGSSRDDTTSQTIAKASRVDDAGLTVIQQPLGAKVQVPIVFKQAADDRKSGGLDEITALSFCVDYDTSQLVLDLSDDDLDGVPDDVRMHVPAGHASFVNVDLTRPSCELHIGVVDFSKPSSLLPDGVLVDIEFGRLRNADSSRGIWVRTGSASALSFADVLGRSLPGQTRSIQRQP